MEIGGVSWLATNCNLIFIRLNRTNTKFVENLLDIFFLSYYFLVIILNSLVSTISKM